MILPSWTDNLKSTEFARCPIIGVAFQENEFDIHANEIEA